MNYFKNKFGGIEYFRTFTSTNNKDMKNHQLEISKVKEFMLGGKATLTIKSVVTGTHFTYSVDKAKFGEVYFVSVLTGSDNSEDFKYIGFLKHGFFNFGGEKSTISKDAQSVKAFVHSAKFIMSGTECTNLEFFHSGHCGRCGRKLTTPLALEIGLGSECMTKTTKPEVVEIPEIPSGTSFKRRDNLSAQRLHHIKGMGINLSVNRGNTQTQEEPRAAVLVVRDTEPVKEYKDTEDYGIAFPNIYQKLERIEIRQRNSGLRNIL